MVLTIQALRSGGSTIKREHHVEPALSGGVEVAGWVGDGGAESERVHGAIDGSRVTVERVEVGDSEQGGAVRGIDVKHVVDGFEHETVSSAQSLIGWLN